MTSFEIKNKVALITGGASGLGYQYALGLLEKCARGVTLADVNAEAGNQAVKEIESKYGKNKAIFVKTDISCYNEFEDAFKKTVETFKNIDILMNNAGILNDSVWEKEIAINILTLFDNIDILMNNAGILYDSVWEKKIAININGTIHGIILGLDNYLPKHKSGSEAVIVNISSIAGISPFASGPIYVGTKFAIHGMTLSWGLPTHYDRSKVKVVGVCPGITMTPLITEIANRTLGPVYENIRIAEMDNKVPTQEREQVVPGVMQIIEKAPSGTIWVVEGGEPPYQYQIPNRFEIPKINL